MKRIIPLLLVLPLLFSSCSKVSLNEEEETIKSIKFSVTNYKVTPFDDITRASATLVDHISWGIFEESTGREVVPLITQNKGDKDYGSFVATLPEGTYQIVTLGYNGTSLCTKLTAREVAFADSYVPHTYLSNTTLTVNPSTSTSQSIVLHRNVSAFTIKVEDKMPQEVAIMRFTTEQGGVTFNPKTGLTEKESGRDHFFTIPEQYRGKEENSITTFIFLPSDATTATYRVDALRTDSSVVRSRTFTDVSMQVNCRTLCSGEFFTDKGYKHTIEIDDAWKDTIKVSY